MVALQHLIDAVDPPLDVETARAEVERLQQGLPPTLLAARPEEIRRLARTALDAEKAALRRRSKVGDEPAIDEDAVDAAIVALGDVRDARQGLAEAATDAMRWLAVGNVWGLVGLAAAGALVVRGHLEPMAAPVYTAVVGAAAGPIATTAFGVTRRTYATTKLARATTAWAEALRVAGFETMGELHARTISRRGWERRSVEAAAADAVARDARAAWHRVAGPKVHPREAPALIARLAVLRAAQLELFRALIAERMRPREITLTAVPTDPDTEPVSVVVDGAHPFEVVWAVPEPVVDVTDDAIDPQRMSVWSRVRGRAVRIWSR
ncbi:MAG TPA: hypothetical protein VM345_05470 [Acidimicrobiales bacterium]|nr:hypothetical protein [Acidimicrobiales bacterium]